MDASGVTSSYTGADAPVLRQPLTTVKPTPLHPLQEAPLSLQDTRSSLDSPLSADASARHLDVPGAQCQLPKRGQAEEAQAALDKLDRIAKARQSKRNWKRGTGMDAAAKLLKPKRKGSDERDDDSSSDIDLGKAKDEVKLMITGNPIVGKVFHAASRAKGRLRGHADSPEVSPQNEQGPFRFPFARPTSSLSRRLRPSSATPPPTAATLLTSASPAPPEPIPEASHEKPAPTRSVKPELLVVDEEGQAHEAADPNQHQPLQRPKLPFSQSFDSATASSLISTDASNGSRLRLGESPGESPSSEQLPKPSDSRGSTPSFTGGLIHDEPEAHEDVRVGPDRTMASSITPSSLSEASSDDELDLDDSALATDSDDDNDLSCNAFLNLEHGEQLTKEQLKRRKKLIRREIKRRKARGETIDDLPHLHGKAGQLGHKVSNRVSKGIHYGTSQSRNRRAMERYSPHPGQLTLQTKDLARATTPLSATQERPYTPFSAVTPSMSRNQNAFGSRRESVASSRRSSMTIDESLLGHGDDDFSTFRKFTTGDRSMISSRNSIRNYFSAPKMLKRHRQKKWDAEMAALEAAAEEDAAKQDPDAELDKMLGKLAQQQAPLEANKVKYEFDVLYENQRGLLVFGIPKFSPRTLFQWDPSPWTSASNKKSPYNIANAQLPDPSWEWVYPEWFIDMTGDTDEAGWQYSGNFGRRFWPNIHFPHGRVGLPKTGVDGIQEMNARLADKEQKRKEKESKKEDDGFEAFLRSARARSDKWSGSPDAWTFVRRRRWIRLRRRKPLVGPGIRSAEPTPSQSKATTPITEKLMDENVTTPSSALPKSVKPGQSDAESSLSGSDESDSSSSEDDEQLYAPANASVSGFLPRRLPGKLSNGPDPTKSHDTAKIAKARKHAREFTGTIRELKTLLPSIIAMDREARVSRAPTGLSASQSSYKWAMLKINRVDARNPFISWKFVKLRLQDEDLAFASTDLRNMERKYQQKRIATLNKAKKNGKGKDSDKTHRRIPSGLMSGGAMPSTKPTTFFGANGGPSEAAAEEDTSPTPASISAQDLFRSPTLDGRELTREALIEINFARVMRVLRACKIDRQRLDLWKLWLGVESLDSMMVTTRPEELEYLGLVRPGDDLDLIGCGAGGSPWSPGASPHMSGGSSFRYRQRTERAKARWRSSVNSPDLSDVWDVLERKLDDILLLFEFQSNRAKLIRLLLTVHERLHPEHMYQDKSIRANPLELSPTHVHGEPAEMGGGGSAGGAFGSRRAGWQKAGLPRLEFFSDLQAILAALPGNEAATNQTYIQARPPPEEVLETIAMPIGHSNPLIAKLEAQAQSEACAGQEMAELKSEATSSDLMPSKNGSIVSFAGKGRDGGVYNLPPLRVASPVTRAPSVPLPYRNSALSSAAGNHVNGGASASTASLQPPIHLPVRSESASPTYHVPTPSTGRRASLAAQPDQDTLESPITPGEGYISAVSSPPAVPEPSGTGPGILSVGGSASGGSPVNNTGCHVSFENEGATTQAATTPSPGSQPARSNSLAVPSFRQYGQARPDYKPRQPQIPKRSNSFIHEKADDGAGPASPTSEQRA